MAGAINSSVKGTCSFIRSVRQNASRPRRLYFRLGNRRDGRIYQGQDGPHYDESVQKAQSDNAEDSVDFFEDDLMRQAIDMVLETGQASTSMLQRRFRIGYTRAARMIDMMEAMHIVGPNNGSKPRDILMTADEVQQKYLG